MFSVVTVCLSVHLSRSDPSVRDVHVHVKGLGIKVISHWNVMHVQSVIITSGTDSLPPDHFEAQIFLAEGQISGKSRLGPSKIMDQIKTGTFGSDLFEPIRHLYISSLKIFNF